MVLCIFTRVHSYGQQPPFSVMDVSGDVRYEQNGKPVLIGATLKNGDRVKMKNGRLLLVCSSSTYLELKTNGTYSVDSKTMCRPTENTTFARLLRFKWQEFMHHADHHEWRNHLDNVGAVYRGGDNCATDIDSNTRYIRYYEGEFNLSWISKSQAPLFLKVYENTSKKPILSIPVAGNTYPLKELKGSLKEGRKYFWKVTPEGEKCQSWNTIEMVSAKDNDSVLNIIASAVNSMVIDKGEQYYLQGVLLEQKHLFADAYKMYIEAIKQSPSNKSYADEKAAFMLRYKIEH